MTPSPPLLELRSIHATLSAAGHRNKNQHRLSKWWKSFSQLRRHISKLAFELESFHHEQQLYGEGHKKTLSSREIVERRVEFLMVLLMPRCFLAFSALVADNQYAALGLMLMGALARVRTLTLPLRKEVELEDAEVGGALEGLADYSELDFGEVVQRYENGGSLREEAKDERDGIEDKKLKKNRRKEEAEPSELIEVPAIVKRPKKKRKKGDAFDDIFGSLI